MLIALVLYLISACVTVYDKYCVMLDRWEKPGLYHQPVPFVLFSVGKVCLVLAYAALFWLFWGMLPALGALAVHFVLGAALLRVFFRKRVAVWLPHMVEAVRHEQDGHNTVLPEPEIQRRALALAEGAAMKAMKDEP